VKSPIPARRRWGQNFLVDRSAAERIVKAAQIAAGESVVEIGPGDGALTRGLAAAGGRLLAIEIDPARADALAAEFSGNDGVVIERGDALDRTIGQRLRGLGWPLPAVVVGNLPYNAATPILRAAVREDAAVSRVVATVQREVARRMIARPGSDDYGYLSLFMAIFCHAEILFDLPPGAFRPRPNVVSSVVRLRTRPVADPICAERVLTIASRGFGARRKTLPNAMGGGAERAPWEAALAAIGKAPTARAEELSPEEFVALAAIAPARPHPPTPSPGGEGEDEQ
jgi:16S rRNA (adenine1518-N6/adenine1519-N6)-dimethyltransferase